MNRSYIKKLSVENIGLLLEISAVIGLAIGRILDIWMTSLWMILLIFTVWSYVKRYEKCQYGALIVLVAFSMEASMQILIEHGYFFALSYQRIIDFCLYLVLLVFSALVAKRKSTGLLIISCVIYVIEILNYVVTYYRGKPIYFPDVFSINTALDVAGGYSFPISKVHILCSVILICNIIFILKFRKNQRDMNRNGIYRMYIPVGIVLFFCVAVVFQIPSRLQLRGYYFSTTEYWLYSFSMSAYQMNMKEPKGYDSDKIPITEESDKKSTPIEKPNIIFIMNESFADLRYISDFENDDKVMPFFDELSKSDTSASGWLYTSIYGGNTANTEFEVLTGVSMNSLPYDTTSYNLYVNHEINNLTTYFKELDYRAIALHLSAATNYNRSNVYPNLGFDECYFQEDYDDLEYLRNYTTSDESNYEKVIELFENKKENKPLFLFNVTVQNHGPFDFKDENFENRELVKDSSLSATEQYLSCLNYSDEALKNFIQYLEDYDEPTIVLFFGDHQAKIDDAFYESLYGKTMAELSEDELKEKYVVPYLIWSNYGQTFNEKGNYMSANYLGAYFIKQIGFPQTAQQKFLNSLREKYPVITSQGISKDGYHYYEKLEDENILTYEKINYNLLFDKQQTWDKIYSLEK